jgi:hypothetical protein
MPWHFPTGYRRSDDPQGADFPAASACDADIHDQKLR